MIGGFLGAGKTTLIARLARHYLDSGQTVGVITNDQADNLVDTAHLRSLGFAVGEVAGSCFCCNFDELIAVADSLGTEQIPDLLLAEPVGSCTDLVATIVRPMQSILGDRFDVAPFGVLLKPSHGTRILSGQRSGFSPQAEYIFRKQLEEADYLMIGRADALSVQQIAELTIRLSELVERTPVVAVSPKTGRGIDEVIRQIQRPTEVAGRSLDIDYDIYAAGEAEMGWVNATAVIDTDEPLPLDQAIEQLVASIAEGLHRHGGEIAHLKASVSGGGTMAIANVVARDHGVQIGLPSNRSVTDRLELVVNARVILDPGVMQTIVDEQIDRWTRRYSLTLLSSASRNLRPGRPIPTHRIPATTPQ